MDYAFALQHLATIAAMRGQAERACRLLGASNALYERFSMPRDHTEQVLFGRTMSTLQAALSAPKLDLHLREGASLPLTQAVSEALSE